MTVWLDPAVARPAPRETVLIAEALSNREFVYSIATYWPDRGGIWHFDHAVVEAPYRWARIEAPAR